LNRHDFAAVRFNSCYARGWAGRRYRSIRVITPSHLTKSYSPYCLDNVLGHWFKKILLALNDIRNLINRPEILSSSDRQGST
jgi:hypothetical protein